jgi:hypothetical protein
MIPGEMSAITSSVQMPQARMQEARTQEAVLEIKTETIVRFVERQDMKWNNVTQ